MADHDEGGVAVGARGDDSGAPGADSPVDGYTPVTLSRFALTATGAVVTAEPTLTEWAGIGELLRTAEKGMQFIIGDLANYGETAFGERAAQELDYRKWNADSLRTYQWVARRVPPENRRIDLSFDHHEKVAALPPEAQREWLQRAAHGEDGQRWSSARLRVEIAKAGAKGVLNPVYWLIIECGSEDRRQALATQLQRDGYRTSTRDGVRKLAAEGSEA